MTAWSASKKLPVVNFDPFGMTNFLEKLLKILLETFRHKWSSRERLSPQTI